MCSAVTAVSGLGSSAVGRRCLVRLLADKCRIAMVALVLFGRGDAARSMRGVCARLGDGRHDAHGHGVAQQAAQDHCENEQQGQAGAHGESRAAIRKKSSASI